MQTTMNNDTLKEYELAAEKVYAKQSLTQYQHNDIAAAILVLAEAIKYHADTTAGFPKQEDKDGR